MKIQLAIIIMYVLMKRIIQKIVMEIGILVIAMSALFVDLQLKNLQSLVRIALINRRQNMKKKRKSGITLLNTMAIHMSLQTRSGVKILHL